MKDEGEKTFDPTPKRRLDAARKGDVLRSREVATAAAILAGAAYLKFAGPWLLESLSQTARASFIFDRTLTEDFTPGRALLDCLVLALPPILLLAIPVVLLTVALQMAPTDGRFVGKNLMPKGSRLNPLSGLKRMFGANGLIEMGKGIAKVVLLGAIAAFWAKGRIAPLLATGRGNLSSQLGMAWDALLSLLFALSAGLVVIALIDLPIQWVRRNQRLRMSHKEMRDEHKESEGSPERKAAIRQRQRQLATGGVRHAMKEAQFMLTNPTHFSVALAYDPALAAAPVVLAKGRGDKAMAMRDVAREMDLPVLEYPQLARSLYYTTRERQMIREELYGAVASVLAFVLSLRRGETRPRPQVSVPLELRFDAEGKPEPKA